MIRQAQKMRMPNRLAKGFREDADKIEATGSPPVNRTGESKTKQEGRKESIHEGRKE